MIWITNKFISIFGCCWSCTENPGDKGTLRVGCVWLFYFQELISWLFGFEVFRSSAICGYAASTYWSKLHLVAFVALNALCWAVLLMVRMWSQFSIVATDNTVFFVCVALAVVCLCLEDISDSLFTGHMAPDADSLSITDACNYAASVHVLIDDLI